MMRTWIAGSLALGLICSTVPVNAFEKQETIRPATLMKAKEVPAFSKQADSALTGRFDSDGLAVWYFDAKDLSRKERTLSSSSTTIRTERCSPVKPTRKQVASTIGITKSRMIRSTSHSVGVVDNT